MRRVGVALFTILLSAGFLLCGNASATAGYEKLIEDLNGGNTLTINGDEPTDYKQYFILESFLIDKYNLHIDWLNNDFDGSKLTNIKLYSENCSWEDSDWIDENGILHTEKGTVCERGEEKTVSLNFVGPKIARNGKVDTLLNSLNNHHDPRLYPETPEYWQAIKTSSYKVTDMALLNYIAAGYTPLNNEDYSDFTSPNEKDKILNRMINFSPEYKNDIANTNLAVVARVETGFGNQFINEINLIPAIVNGDSYYTDTVDEAVSAVAINAIYIPESTEDSSNAFIAAATKRIKDYYAGTEYENVFTISHSGAFDGTEIDAIIVENMFDTVPEDYYTLSYNGNSFPFFIIKDDAEMIEPEFATADIGTDIEIHSDDPTIPLDSAIEVEQIDTKDRADKIKLIGLTGAEIYDLSIYSFGAGIQTSKGNFMVYIPVSPALNGKNLTAYWVSDEGKIEEHPVTIQNGFAIFETNHFSEYILGTSDGVNPQTLDMIQASIITFASCGVVLLASLKRSSLRR